MLCKHHHDQLGDQLEPQKIKAALRGSASQTSITFPGYGEKGSREIAGVSIMVGLDDAPWKVRLFFTREHQRVWLADP